MSFWDIVWFIVISFAFCAYLMVMFSIIGDIFRDRASSGAAKAAWLIALIFLPFLTAVIYMIVKGRSMAERSADSVHAQRQRQDDYIREVASKSSPAEQIAKGQAMRDSGVISQTEFDRLKEKALV
jgi:Phospholipase_D-nuclease N-terminal